MTDHDQRHWVKAKDWWEVAPSCRNILIQMASLLTVDIRNIVVVCGKCGYKKQYNIKYESDETRCEACRTINKL